MFLLDCHSVLGPYAQCLPSPYKSTHSKRRRNFRIRILSRQRSRCEQPLPIYRSEYPSVGRQYKYSTKYGE